MATAQFFHAGCPVCVGAEQMLAAAIDSSRYTVESIHLGENPDLIPAAEAAGIVSVPALVLDGNVFHINHGASMDDLKAA